MATYYIGIPTDNNGLHDWIEPHYIQTPTGDQYIDLGSESYYTYSWMYNELEYAVYEYDTEIDFPNGYNQGLFAHSGVSLVNGGPQSLPNGTHVWDYAGVSSWTPTFGEDEGETLTPIYLFDEYYIWTKPEPEPEPEPVTYYFWVYVQNYADNASMPGVTINVYSDSGLTSLVQTGTTDLNGRYYFTSTYKNVYIKATKDGYYDPSGYTSYSMTGNVVNYEQPAYTCSLKLKSNQVSNDYYYVVSVRDDKGVAKNGIKCEFCTDFSFWNPYGESVAINSDDAKDNVFIEVRKLIGDVIGIDPITINYNDKFKQDLGFDSLNAVDLAMNVNNIFGIDLEQSDLNTIITIEDLVTRIQEKSRNGSTITKSVYITKRYKNVDGLIVLKGPSGPNPPRKLYARLFNLPDIYVAGTPSSGPVNATTSDLAANLTLRVSTYYYSDDYYYNVKIIDKNTNKPIPDAVVRYMDSSTNLLKETVTDTDGLASYYSGEDNEVRISIYKDEYMNYDFQLCASTGDENTYTDILLTPKNSIRVVYEDDGSPAYRVNVNIFTYDSSNKYINLGKYKTNAQGYIDTLKMSLYTSGNLIYASVSNEKRIIVPGNIVIEIPRQEEQEETDPNVFKDFNNISVNGIKKNLTNGNIELNNKPDSEKVTYNTDDFRINIVDPDTINVYDIFTSTPVMIYNNQKNVIGSVDIGLKPDVNDLALKMVNRYSGYYNPIFKDILFYNNFKTGSGDQEKVYPYSNTSFDHEYSDKYGKFGVINNMWFHKVNDNKDVEIINTLTPYYPLTGQYALDYRDYNIFSSNWDTEYYTRQTGLHTSKACQNIASMKEGLCMFGSKYLNVPETIEIYGLTLGDNESWNGEWNDEWITNPNGCPGEIMFKEVNDNSVDFYFFFKKRILRYFYDHLKDEFDKYIDADQFSFGKEGIEDDIEEYVSKNILKLYKLEKVRIFVKREKKGIHNSRIENDYTTYLEFDKTATDPTDKAYFDNHTYVEYFRSHGFVEVNNATMTKMNRDDFDRKLVYNLRTGTKESFGFGFILKKI
jgi:acyl carrier protein